MEAEEQLMQQIRDALELRRLIAEDEVILLDSDKAIQAFDLMTKARIHKPKKPRLSENLKLWGLVAIAGGSMLAAVKGVYIPNEAHEWLQKRAGEIQAEEGIRVSMGDVLMDAIRALEDYENTEVIKK